MKDFSTLPNYLGKMIFDDSWKWILATAMAAVEFVLPTSLGRDMCIACCVLIALDTITGAIASAVAGHAISSAKFARVLVKLIGYGSVLIVASIATKFIPGAPSEVSVTAVLTLVIVTECISILENVRRMGLKLPFGLDKWLGERFPSTPEQSPE